MSEDKRSKANRQTREKMKGFMAGAEVNGQTIQSFLKAAQSHRDTIVRILAENRIPDPKPGLWYPQHAWLSAFRAIAEKIGPEALYAIGRKIPESADWPAHIDSLEKAYLHIGRHPASGSPRHAHELNLPDLRFWPVPDYPYVVFYIENEEHIDVWRVLHGQRDIPAWMAE